MRRLPVLQATSDPAEERPAWQWTLIGALLVISIWLPLAMVGSLVLGRAMRASVGGESPEDIARFFVAASPHDRVRTWALIGSVHALTLAGAALSGGTMVGRFGGRAGPREAALSGLLVAVAAWVLAVWRAEVAPSLALFVGLALLSGGFAWIGGKLGFHRRAALATRPAPPPPSRGSGVP